MKKIDEEENEEFCKEEFCKEEYFNFADLFIFGEENFEILKRFL